MYGVYLDIRPTGTLTFRRMPSAISHISTYPFVPPTTLSGWLRRLLMLSKGIYPETAVKQPNFYAMSADFQVLGAYPTPFKQFYIHTARRHGPMFQSKHVVFSRLYRNKQDEGNYEKLQLHTWEYLLVERLRGYILHEQAEALEQLRAVQNHGCKLGKEGFAVLEYVSPIQELQRRTESATPATLVPGKELLLHPSHLYALYRYDFKTQKKQIIVDDLHTAVPSQITGFIPFWGGTPHGEIELDYWVYADDQVTSYLPVALGEELYGTA